MRLVEKVLLALEELSAHPDGVGVTELSERLSEPPSSVHRLLATLVDHGYARQEPQFRRYFVGPAVSRLWLSYQRHDALVQLSRPHIAALSKRSQESVFLAELIGDDVICMASIPSQRTLTIYVRLGVRTAFHASASARAVLAFQPESRQRLLLEREPLERYTDRTPTSVSEALARLAETASRGYAICDREKEHGVSAIAAPVRDAAGTVVASIAVVAPHERLEGERRGAIVEMLLETAGAVSEEYGYIKELVGEKDTSEQPEDEASVFVESTEPIGAGAKR